MSAAARTTTDHDEIRRWVEARAGRPASVCDIEADQDFGALRILFRDDAALEEIGWDAFFAAFEQEELAFLYLAKTGDGSRSRFCKFVNRR